MVNSNRWQVVSAAVSGSSHRRQGIPCQDAVDYRIIKNNRLPDSILLVALADGAGSAPLAEKGAQWAVEAAMQAMESRLADGLPKALPFEPDEAGWEDSQLDDWERTVLEIQGFDDDPPEGALALNVMLRQTFKAARSALIDLADESGNPLRWYATTLICAVVSPNWIAAGQLGDGAVVASSDDSGLFCLNRLQRGEYANETYFLTQEDALEQMETQVADSPITSVAVMSDGLIRLALNMRSKEPHQPFFQPLFAFAAASENNGEAHEKLAAFLDSERVLARTDDDKALVLAVLGK